MSLWKTAPNPPACPFTHGECPKLGPADPTDWASECGHPCVAPVVQLCASEGVVLGPPIALGAPAEGGGSPPAHPTRVHSIFLHTGKQRRMWFQSKVPRSAISKGASWE